MMERIFNLMFLAFGFCSCGVFAKSRFSAKCADRIMDIEIESIQVGIDLKAFFII